MSSHGNTIRSNAAIVLLATSCKRSRSFFMHACSYQVVVIRAWHRGTERQDCDLQHSGFTIE